jgi:hypothetical protein
VSDRAIDVVDLERRRLRALVEGDLATAGQLHADDYELVSPGGDRWSKTSYLDAIGSGLLDYLVFEPDSDVQILALTEAVALRYVARIDIQSSEGWHDRGRFLHTDIWRLRDGHWQAVWSQATQMADE